MLVVICNMVILLPPTYNMRNYPPPNFSPIFLSDLFFMGYKNRESLKNFRKYPFPILDDGHQMGH